MFDAKPNEIPVNCSRAWVGQVPRNMDDMMNDSASMMTLPAYVRIKKQVYGF